MAPRCGKTSGLAIPAILAAPGPVLLTSNKAANDAFTATFDARAAVGHDLDARPAADRPPPARDVVGHPRRRPRPRRRQAPGRALRRRQRGRVERLGLLVHRREQHPRRPVPGRRQPRTPDHRRPRLARLPRRPDPRRPAHRRRPPRRRRPAPGHRQRGHRNPGRHLRDGTAVRELPARPGGRRLGHPRPAPARVQAGRRSPPPATRCTC